MLILAMTWMNLENTMLSEISHIQTGQVSYDST